MAKFRMPWMFCSGATTHSLQGLLGAAPADEQELQARNLEQLRAMTSELQEKLRSRTPAQ